MISFLFKFLIKFLLDSFEPIFVKLLPLHIVLQLQLYWITDLDVLSDQPQWQFKDLHVVGDEDKVVVAGIADVVGLFVDGLVVAVGLLSRGVGGVVVGFVVEGL